jgi:multiple sugar transport system permease protein
MASGLRAGLYIFIFRQFFAGISKELEEAASIDGCGPIRTFYQIMIPLAVPAFVTVLLFSIIWYWNDYFSASIYFVDEIKPLTVMLKNLNGILISSGLVGGSNPLNSRMFIQAGALITIAPLLILYLFTQKFFTESIERTGIVG